MIDDRWYECLGSNLRWFETYRDNPPPLIEIINRLLESREYDDVTDVYESSVWAVCHAYIDYRIGTSFLSPEELEYTRSRSGVLGVHIYNGGVRMATIREYLEHFDPGFRVYMSRHVGPPAA